MGKRLGILKNWLRQLRALWKEPFGSSEQRKQIEPADQKRLEDLIAQGQTRAMTIPGEKGSLVGHLHWSNPDPAKESTAIVLFLGGSHTAVEGPSLQVLKSYKALGVDVLAMNYRGFGKSEGEPSEKGIYRDADTMLRFVLEDVAGAEDKIKIYLHGHGMGCAVAARALAKAQSRGQKIEGMVLDDPVPSMSKSVQTPEARLGMGRLAGSVMEMKHGSFNVLDNLRRAFRDTKIVMLNGKPRHNGQINSLRARLVKQGFDVKGKPGSTDTADGRRPHYEFNEIRDVFFLPDAKQAAVPDQVRSAPDEDSWTLYTQGQRRNVPMATKSDAAPLVLKADPALSAFSNSDLNYLRQLAPYISLDSSQRGRSMPDVDI
jgi:RTX toxin RtxA